MQSRNKSRNVYRNHTGIPQNNTGVRKDNVRVHPEKKMYIRGEWCYLIYANSKYWFYILPTHEKLYRYQCSTGNCTVYKWVKRGETTTPIHADSLFQKENGRPTIFNDWEYEIHKPAYPGIQGYRIYAKPYCNTGYAVSSERMCFILDEEKKKDGGK